MNSTIFVQQNIGIPAGPLKPTDTTTAAPVPQTNPAEKQSVGAIIRPRPLASGKQGSVRLDPVSSEPPKQHVRNHDLTDYVNWLREKIKRDHQDTRRGATADPSADADVERNTTSSQSTLDISLPIQPQPIPARKSSANNIHRIDERHEGISEAYLKFDELRTLHENAAVSVVETHSGISGVNLETTSNISSADTDLLVAEISKAIASVLTENPEQVVEQKLQSKKDSGPVVHPAAYANETNETNKQPDVPVDQTDRTNLFELAQSGGNPVMAMKSEAEKITAEILNHSPQEIPTSVAAWDVEDFRWPVVTNRMIVSGGDSLDKLSRSVFEMVSPVNHRLAVAGLGRGEGTTSIAISLARWAVASGKKVLLVNADLVTPNLTKQVGLAPNLSWINAVSQSLASAEVVVRSQRSNLCIMPLAEMVSRVTWPRFIYDNLGEVVDQVRDHFDLIVIDVGPANQLLAELSRSSLLVDATLLVHNGVDSAEFQKTKNRLEMFGLHKMIVAENRARQASVNVA